MRRAVGAVTAIAVIGVVIWRKVPSISRAWRSFRTFSAPSASLYDLLAESVFSGIYALIARDARHALKAGASVLDIGCGPGAMVMRLALGDPTLQLTGLDISREMLELASSRARAGGVGGQVRFLQGDARRLPLKDGEFDLVISSLSLHHWSDPAEGLREVHRVLKPGGLALIYDVPRWLMRLETRIPWLDELAKASLFERYSLRPVWCLGPVSLLWRLMLLPSEAWIRQPGVRRRTVW